MKPSTSRSRACEVAVLAVRAQQRAPLDLGGRAGSFGRLSCLGCRQRLDEDDGALRIRAQLDGVDEARERLAEPDAGAVERLQRLVERQAADRRDRDRERVPSLVMRDGRRAAAAGTDRSTSSIASWRSSTVSNPKPSREAETGRDEPDDLFVPVDRAR